ncbi:hypothetical protein ERO13_A10G078650v2, partial [Gossypium hirsutum]
FSLSYFFYYFIYIFINLCNLPPLLEGSCAIFSSESILLQHIPLTAYFVLKSLLIISFKHSKNASFTGVISAKLLEIIISCFTADFDASSFNIQSYAN